MGSGTDAVISKEVAHWRSLIVCSMNFSFSRAQARDGRTIVKLLWPVCDVRLACVHSPRTFDVRQRPQPRPASALGASAARSFNFALHPKTC